MKKTLLFSVITAVSLMGNINAQTTTWDFTAQTPAWSSSGIAAISGPAAGEYVDAQGLGLHGIATNGNFGAHNTTSSATWSAPADAFTGTYRVQTNGAGFSSGASDVLPTQRYFFLQVDNQCTVKVWFKSGSGGAVRKAIVSNGSVKYGEAATNTGSTTGLPTDGQFLSANVTSAGTFFIYGDTAINIYKIQVEGANVSATPTNTLAVKDSTLDANKVQVFSGNDQQLFVKNIKSATTVQVYTMSGVLVKNLNVSSDVNLSLKQGNYIVNVLSNEGKLSKKVQIK